MYTIGEFALIAEVSTKTLRYYDDIGLFKPFKIDNVNNYRYYNKNQINEIMFIKELKKYGLSLLDIKEIKEIKNKQYLNDILEKQLLSIDRQILALKNMKMSIKGKIESSTLWSEKNYDSDYVVDKLEMKSEEVIFVRNKIEFKEIGKLIGKLYEAINKFNVKIKGSHMIIIHSRCEDEIVDIEVFAPIEKNDMLMDIYKRKFVGGTFLRTIHKGIKGKGNAYANIYDFAKKNNYKVLEPVIEKYEMNKGDFNIEIMFKIDE